MNSSNVKPINENVKDKVIFVKESSFGTNNLLKSVSGVYPILINKTVKIKGIETSPVIKLTPMFENSIFEITTKSKSNYLVVKDSEINKIQIIFSNKTPEVNEKIKGYLLYRTYLNGYVLKTDFISEDPVRRKKTFSDRICVCKLQNDKLCIVIKENI